MTAEAYLVALNLSFFLWKMERIVVLSLEVLCVWNEKLPVEPSLTVQYILGILVLLIVEQKQVTKCENLYHSRHF